MRQIVFAYPWPASATAIQHPASTPRAMRMSMFQPFSVTHCGGSSRSLSTVMWYSIEPITSNPRHHTPSDHEQTHAAPPSILTQ